MSRAAEVLKTKLAERRTKAPASGSPEHRRRVLIRVAVAGFLLFPFVLPSNWANMANAAAIWCLALLSLVVLTGWVGQVSLAQAALMGVGAFTAAQATNRLGLEFPFHGLAAGAAAALVATGIGLAALRIRGLYLAIATLAFQWMMEASFLEWHPFSGGFNGIGIDPLHIGPYDFSQDRLFFFLAWPTVILAILLVANIRDSKTGRAWFAIRGSEVAAKSVGIDVVRYKLIGFAVAGFIVGVAGSLNLNFIGTATPLDYNFTKSITYLAVAVLGGIGAIAGAVVGSIAFVLSDRLVFAEIDSLRGKIDIAASVLLMVTIVRNPGGLVTIREDIKEKIAEKRARHEAHARRDAGPPPPPAPDTAPVPVVAAGEDAAEPELVGAGPKPVSGAAVDAPADPSVADRIAAHIERRGERTVREATPVLLDASGITVRFGGVVANDHVNLQVRQGEICGLIGPNGAGKTTFFNTINGLITPNEGTVSFMGQNITEAPVHERAALGMARTFQIMRLFPRLTVFENLMVATHLRNGSSFVANMLMLETSRGEDRRNADRVREILAFLGIAEHADKRVAGLPFGILRLVELGRALVASPQVLLLDEPASGLDVSETDRFAEILFRIREEMGHTVLLIEHDMRLVMMVSDYVYVLEFGRNLAEGLPAEVQENAAVIAAYLGEEAIA